jgi:glycosyltransferase involved in cell wall biosynthesis
MPLELSKPSQSLRVAIGVGGRFHADRMAQALIGQGHSLTLFSSLPRFRFKNLPSQVIEPIIYPELVFRGLRKLSLEKWGADFKMAQFGKALAKRVSQRKWDVFIGWSSFSKEVLENKLASRHILIRDSSHISYQMDLLNREYSKLGIPFRRDNLAEERECIEYELADEIVVLSDFAKQTFLDKGIKSSKIKVIRLGVDTLLFSPSESSSPFVQRPLQVVYFGAVSVRKGAHYLLECSNKFKPDEIQFHIIGGIEKDLEKKIKSNPFVQWHSPMPQEKLASFLKKMDVFVFPTLEDGFGQTLIQAMSSGLVPIFTRQSGAAECVEKSDGIFIEAGSAYAVEEALMELLKNPEKLDFYRKNSLECSKKMTWENYNQQIQALIGSN